ncbi:MULTISPECIES: hypothetical protein [Paenibacillus]|uniref:hypothetical protein n=1 Tax=Paenibacillus TaxID=44249 RepID=UPI0015C324CA|nr:hypothetical protein [Paenibacillus lautus]
MQLPPRDMLIRAPTLGNMSWYAWGVYWNPWSLLYDQSSHVLLFRKCFGERSENQLVVIRSLSR